MTEHTPSPEVREPEPPHAPSKPEAARESKTVPFVVASAVGVVLVVGGALIWHAESRVNKVALSDSAKPVTVTVARSTPYQPSRTYVGTLAPWLAASIGPQLVSAYIDTVLVRPGAIVKRGEVLATLDCRDASAANQAVAMSARAIDARQKALASESARVQDLLASKFVSPNEAEQKAAASAAEAAELESMKAKLSHSTLEVNDCVLRAPFDGEIATRTMDPGGFVRPGMSIVSVVDRSTVRLAADVPEIDFAVVPPGTAGAHHRRPRPSRSSSASSRAAPPPPTRRRARSTSRSISSTPTRHIPVGTTGEARLEVGAPQPATEIPLYAATVRGNKATVFVVEGDVAHLRTVDVKGEIGGSLFVDTSLAAGAQIVTEGRALLTDGDRVIVKMETDAAPPPSPAASDRQGPRPGPGQGDRSHRREGAPPMTGLSLRNPIAVLMLCIGLVVFAAVVTPRMSVDTFPELTPPVLVIGTLAPGLGPKDVEKTITWRLEKYVSATPGVDHVESVSRNNLSIIYVWLKWGTDLNSAQTLVQQQAAFAMAAVPKSLGVLPPFVLQYDPSNAPVVQVVVERRGLHRAAALRLRAQQHRAAARGHLRRRQRRARRRPDAPDQRRRRPGQGPGARPHRRGRRRGRGQVQRAPALGRVHLAQVRRQRLHQRRSPPPSRPSATRR